MLYRTYRYFTRPSIRAADREREDAGIQDRHGHPDYAELPKKGPFVIKAAYPFMTGCGDGIPQMHCIIMWAEGGMRWHMDITLDRYKRLPKLTSENPHDYTL